ncbi:MAG: hypothetical protein A2W18_01545 [Candidatus Muproteobacteria bacterium RBG_16_60_9]|uniref:CMP/dCMP-type deaminase domain-containing protein n=1 Tax=Candidatus Muproteobacteria bacterium RBG_16_60_9 TaxID=1817755 RepID=A0A1F6V2P7_9PROT|nr:MAG: hypothetical protein A2W18_01545 [Candidatus Muproteobacteria bacterium RBG_16_60_9]
MTKEAGIVAPPHGPEIVLALVGALGVDLDFVTRSLESELQAVGYGSKLIHLSKYMKEIERWASISSTPLDTYIEKLQDAGNEFREVTQLGDAMARLAIGKIRDYRTEKHDEPRHVVPRTAYIIRQLKHPDEVSLLRHVYGQSFFLIAAYAPREVRLQTSAGNIAASYNSLQVHNFRVNAEKLIKRDEEEADNPFGQNVRHTFPEADVFINTTDPERLRKSITRFVDLIFGHPFQTPTPDEFAMFHAKAAALRSADLARQVGAVIASADGGVVAVGANEVPRAGGGLYWSGDRDDSRDFVLGKDKSREMRESALGDILVRLRKDGWFNQQKSALEANELVKQALPIMKNTRLMGIGEFGRAVHAEMAAILDAARRGVAVQDRTLYSTTFPCHNCTRHIVGAGISKVVYIEPYPKSLASVLHADSIVIESAQEVKNKVVFEPFVGIAPRKYLELFSMPDRRDRDGKPINWEKHGAIPRFNAPPTYTDRETVVVSELRQKMDAAGLKPKPAEQ